MKIKHVWNHHLVFQAAAHIPEASPEFELSGHHFGVGNFSQLKKYPPNRKPDRLPVPLFFRGKLAVQLPWGGGMLEKLGSPKTSSWTQSLDIWIIFPNGFWGSYGAKIPPTGPPGRWAPGCFTNSLWRNFFRIVGVFWGSLGAHLRRGYVGKIIEMWRFSKPMGSYLARYNSYDGVLQISSYPLPSVFCTSASLWGFTPAYWGPGTSQCKDSWCVQKWKQQKKVERSELFQKWTKYESFLIVASMGSFLWLSFLLGVASYLFFFVVLKYQSPC